MMKIAVVTANMGDFEKPVEYTPQSMPYDFYQFNDRNFRPRIRSMTPRLQARIPKMFGWQMAPGYDYYIWVDASYSLLHPDSVKWFFEQGRGVDIALIAHPQRNSIEKEAYYLRVCLRKRGAPYIRTRYKNELIREQLREIKSDKGYVDNCLFASTSLIYRNNERVHSMMKEWWYHTSRYHSVDQLSLPYAIYKAGCTVNVIPSEFYEGPYQTFVRT